MNRAQFRGRQQRAFQVHVGIDEPGRDNSAGKVDGALCLPVVSANAGDQPSATITLAGSTGA